MDPHKRSATIEIIDDRETVLAGAGPGRCDDPPQLGNRRTPGRRRAA
jgi:hypothetical protein